MCRNRKRYPQAETKSPPLGGAAVHERIHDACERCHSAVSGYFFRRDCADMARAEAPAESPRFP